MTMMMMMQMQEVYKVVFQVIAAEGEQKASRALREASDVITESAAALQLRYLQVPDININMINISTLS